MGVEGTVYTIASHPFRKTCGVSDHNRWYVRIRCQCGSEREVPVKVLRVTSQLPRMCRTCYYNHPPDPTQRGKYKNPLVLPRRTGKARRVKRFFSQFDTLRKNEMWPDPILIDKRKRGDDA